MSTPAFSVVVPVRNEGRRIVETASYLLDGLPLGTEIVFVCNGCTDDSENLLHAIAAEHSHVMISAPGKTTAIREAERHLTTFPRFFVDSDVLVSGKAITIMAEELLARDLMLISPRIVINFDKTNWVMRQIHALWLDLPHGRDAFHHVLGVSAAGRRRWGLFPDVIADDSFIEAMIPTAARALSFTEKVYVRPAQTWWSFVHVRARWLRGQRELASLGILRSRTKGQRLELLRLIPTRLPAVILYITARAVAYCPWIAAKDWYTDMTSRDPF